MMKLKTPLLSHPVAWEGKKARRRLVRARLGSVGGKVWHALGMDGHVRRRLCLLFSALLSWADHVMEAAVRPT